MQRATIDDSVLVVETDFSEVLQVHGGKSVLAESDEAKRFCSPGRCKE